MNPGRPPRPRIEHEDGCWTFPVVPFCQGYQLIKRNGKRQSAHRWSWEQANGPIPDHLQIDHLCRNRQCHNPDHLRLVTAAENIRASPRCKLNMEKARAIRCSNKTQAALSREYNVNAATIAFVQQGVTWRE